MTTKSHSQACREAFERWIKDSSQPSIHNHCQIRKETWQAATAVAEAKYLPVIEKLVEAAKGLREYGKVTTKELDLALAEAATLLKGE